MLKSVVPETVFQVVGEPITSLQYLDPGYPNTNWVYSVDTVKNNYILKVIGHGRKFKKGCIWYGLKHLFGCNPARELTSYIQLTDFLRKASTFEVPRVLEVETDTTLFGAPYILMERIPGSPIDEDDFHSSEGLLFQFGQHVGNIHRNRFDHFGNMTMTAKHLIHRFPRMLAQVMKKLVRYGWRKNPRIKRMLPQYFRKALEMPLPGFMAPIMVDIGPSQFLFKQDTIAGLVDLEGFIIGPPELELAAIELSLKNPTPFIEGYRSRNGSFPCCIRSRDIFRFFIFLLFDAECVLDFDTCMKAPSHFG